MKAEKAEAEKISPEKWQSVLRARGRWIFSVVTRAAQCERATFLVADFGGFVVHPFPDLNPSLPPTVHYLNKQAERRGRLAAACTLSLPPSLFLYNKCASRLSLHFLDPPYFHHMRLPRCLCAIISYLVPSLSLCLLFYLPPFLSRFNSVG